MPIKGTWVVPSKLADGTKRYHYYTSRAPDREKFWESDGERVDLGYSLPEGFAEAYAAANQLSRGIYPGSFEATIFEYRKKSAAYKRMRQKSQETRDKYLEAWLDMQLKEGKLARQAPISVFDKKKIMGYITAHRDARWSHSPSAADEAIFALSAFLKWCVSVGKLNDNKAAHVPSIYERPEGARIWEEAEQIAFLQDCPWQLRAGFQLSLYTGLRLGDLVRLPVTARTRDHLMIATGKSRGAHTAPVSYTHLTLPTIYSV